METERTEQREERAEKREADDLVAQQRAATAAERAANASESQNAAAWWQTGLAGIGTLALLYTLYLTRRSVKEAARSADAAVAAAKIAKDNAVTQLRAYVHVEAVQGIMAHGEAGQFRAKVLVKNFGATPAYAFKSRLSIAIKQHPAPDANFEEPPPDMPVVTSIVPSSGTVPLEIKTSFAVGPYVDALKASRWAFYVYGTVTYKDVFGTEQFTKYRFLCTGNRLFEDGHFDISSAGNDAS